MMGPIKAMNFTSLSHFFIYQTQKFQRVLNHYTLIEDLKKKPIEIENVFKSKRSQEGW